MTHILHVDTSPRSERSISRKLSHQFMATWKTTHPDATVTYRDIGHHAIPAVDEPWIAAAYSAPDQRTPEQAAAIQLSDSLVDEFLAADRYVFGVPMYNFGIPANLKAYIDQIVRVGRTFTIDENGYRGLVTGDRKALVITSRGGAYPDGTPYKDYDMQQPYLNLIFGFMGITDVQFVHAENLMGGDEAKAKAIASAEASFEAIAPTW